MTDNNDLAIRTSAAPFRGGILPLLAVLLGVSCAWLGPERTWDNPFDPEGINPITLPTITISCTDTVIAVNDTVMVKATATVSGIDTIKAYHWSLDDDSAGSTSSSGNFRKAWGVADSGRHTIRVVAIDRFDLSSNEVQCTVTVHAIPPRIIAMVTDTAVAQKATVAKTFSASDSNGRIVMFLWSSSGTGWTDSVPADTGSMTISKSFSNSVGGPLNIRWAVRDDDGLFALDSFTILFNRGPDSLRLLHPAPGENARFVSYDLLKNIGRISCRFSGHDPDIIDTLRYTFWLGKNDGDTVMLYRGRDTVLTIDSIAASTSYHWRLSVRDLFGDSATASGDFTTDSPPPPPAGMVLVKSAGRDFQMGQSGFDSSEAPIHTVIFSGNFWIDTTEVTAGAYGQAMGLAGSSGDAARLPAVNISWFDAALYCNARSKLEKRDTVYSYQSKIVTAGKTMALNGLSINPGAAGYRLPSEAEWEYACRLDSVTLFFWGNAAANAGQYVWTKENSSAAPHAVALKKPNRAGCYDMAGNVWEWCNDWFDPGYYATAPRVDPVGPQSGSQKVLRGGSYENSLYFAQAGTRSRLAPQSGSASVGFRTVLSAR